MSLSGDVGDAHKSPEDHDKPNSRLPRRWPRLAVLLVLGVFVLPYLSSRLLSPWRCVSVCAIESDYGPRPAMPPTGRPTGFRIATYNIAHGRGLAESNWDGGNANARLERLDSIADVLRDIDADVVILNEVDFQSAWSYGVDQARYLAQRAGYRYCVEQRNVDLRLLVWTCRFGNAILSRYSVSEARVLDLPGYALWETLIAGKKRGVICDLEVGGTVIRVAGIHFSHRSEHLRVESAGMLTSLADAHDVPVLAAGDFNSTPPGFPKTQTDRHGTNAIDTLDRGGSFQRSPINPPRPDQFTFSSVSPSSVIDWIMIPRDWAFMNYQTILTNLSDHRPVYADVLPPARVSSSDDG